MKKTLLAAVVSFFAAQNASSNEFFFGMDLGKTQLQMDGGSSSRNLLHDGSVNSDIVTLGFRAGVINDKYRLYGVLGNGLSSSEKNGILEEKLRYAQLTGNVDFFFPVNNQFSLFAGPHLGLAFVDVEVDHPYQGSDSDSASGIAYGGQFGVIYDITENWGIEIGYSLSFTTIDDEVKHHGSEGDIKINQAGRFILDVTYTL